MEGERYWRHQDPEAQWFRQGETVDEERTSSQDMSQPRHQPGSGGSGNTRL